MERTPETDGSSHSARSAKAKQPLYLRMYQRRHLVELVRLFKHASIPIEQVREQLKPFVEQYGKQTMEDAAEEILFIDDSQSPVVVRLTDEARQLAIPLIGRPPPPKSDGSPSTSVCNPVMVPALAEPIPAKSAAPPDTTSTSAPARTRRARPKKSEAAEMSAPNSEVTNSSTSESGRKKRTKSSGRRQA